MVLAHELLHLFLEIVDADSGWPRCPVPIVVNYSDSRRVALRLIVDALSSWWRVHGVWSMCWMPMLAKVGCLFT